jgi:hypothetical protein
MKVLSLTSHTQHFAVLLIAVLFIGCRVGKTSSRYRRLFYGFSGREVRIERRQRVVVCCVAFFVFSWVGDLDATRCDHRPRTST